MLKMPRRVVAQRDVGQGTDHDFQQFRIDGASAAASAAEGAFDDIEADDDDFDDEDAEPSLEDLAGGAGDDE